MFFYFTYERIFCILSLRGGTNVRNQLVKSMRYKNPVDMMYMSNEGVVSKRRIQVLQLDNDNFRAYCFLRKSKRTFRVDNVLAIVPVIQKESMVI